MADKRLAPDEPPITMPSPPKMHKLGTKLKLAENLKSGNADKQQQLKYGGCKKRDDTEERGEGDRWSEMQFNIMTTVDETLVEFKIEMLFDYRNKTEGGRT